MTENSWLILVSVVNVVAMWVSILAARRARRYADRAEKWSRLAGASLSEARMLYLRTLDRHLGRKP